jgi:hypothetical protein
MPRRLGLRPRGVTSRPRPSLVASAPRRARPGAQAPRQPRAPRSRCARRACHQARRAVAAVLSAWRRLLLVVSSVRAPPWARSSLLRRPLPWSPLSCSARCRFGGASHLPAPCSCVAGFAAPVARSRRSSVGVVSFLAAAAAAASARPLRALLPLGGLAVAFALPRVPGLAAPKGRRARPRGPALARRRPVAALACVSAAAGWASAFLLCALPPLGASLLGWLRRSRGACAAQLGGRRFFLGGGRRSGLCPPAPRAASSGGPRCGLRPAARAWPRRSAGPQGAAAGACARAAPPCGCARLCVGGGGLGLCFPALRAAAAGALASLTAAAASASARPLRALSPLGGLAVAFALLRVPGFAAPKGRGVRPRGPSLARRCPVAALASVSAAAGWASARLFCALPPLGASLWFAPCPACLAFWGASPLPSLCCCVAGFAAPVGRWLRPRVAACSRRCSVGVLASLTAAAASASARPLRALSPLGGLAVAFALLRVPGFAAPKGRRVRPRGPSLARRCPVAALVFVSAAAGWATACLLCALPPLGASLPGASRAQCLLATRAAQGAGGQGSAKRLRKRHG